MGRKGKYSNAKGSLPGISTLVLGSRSTLVHSQSRRAPKLNPFQLLQKQYPHVSTEVLQLALKMADPSDSERSAQKLVLELCPNIQPSERGQVRKPIKTSTKHSKNSRKSSNHRTSFILASKSKHEQYSVESNRMMHAEPHKAIFAISEKDQRAFDFVRSARFGDLESVEAMLKEGVPINSCDYHGRTALHWAAQAREHVIVRKLLSSGNAYVDPDSKASISICDKSGWTPLHAAAFSGCLESLRLLLNSGAKCDARTNDNSTPLHLAVYWGRTNVVNELLNRFPQATLLEDRWGRRPDAITLKGLTQTKQVKLRAAQLTAALRESALDVKSAKMELERVLNGAELRYDFVREEKNDDIADSQAPFSKCYFVEKYGGTQEWDSARPARPATAIVRQQEQRALDEVEKIQMAKLRMSYSELKLIGATPKLRSDLREIRSNNKLLDQLLHVAIHGAPDENDGDKNVPKAVLINGTEHKLYKLEISKGGGPWDYFWLHGKNMRTAVQMPLRRGQLVRYRWPKAKDRGKKNDVYDVTDPDPLWKKFKGDPYYVIGARVLATQEKKIVPGDPTTESKDSESDCDYTEDEDESGEENTNKTKDKDEKVDVENNNIKTKASEIGIPKAPPDLRIFESGRIVRFNNDGSFGVEIESLIGQEEETVINLFCENLKYPILRNSVRVQVQRKMFLLRGKKTWFKGVIDGENSNNTFNVLLDVGEREENVAENKILLENETPDKDEDDNDSVQFAQHKGKKKRVSYKRKTQRGLSTRSNELNGQTRIPLKGDTLKINNVGRSYATLENEWVVALELFDARPLESYTTSAGIPMKRRPKTYNPNDPKRTWIVRLLSGDTRRVLVSRKNLIKLAVGATKDLGRMEELKTQKWAMTLQDKGGLKDSQTTANDLRDYVRELHARFPSAHYKQLRYSISSTKGVMVNAAKYLRKKLGLKEVKVKQNSSKFKSFTKTEFCKNPNCSKRQLLDENQPKMGLVTTDFCGIHQKPTASCVFMITGLKSIKSRHLNGSWACLAVPSNEAEERQAKRNAKHNLYEVHLNKLLLPQEVLSVVAREVDECNIPTRLTTAQRYRVSTATRNYMKSQESKQVTK